MSYIAPYSSQEEFLNALTHGVGVCVAVAALVYMINVTPADLSGWQKAGVVVYGISLVLMFLTSTLYHAVAHPRAKQVLKRFDHCAIYLLIAGSFTPLLTIAVQSPSANVVLIIVWLMAAVGVVFKAFFAGRFEWISIGTYLLMGWLSVTLVYELYLALPTPGFVLLVAGGLAYTVGVIFYMSKRIPFNHAIWHCFVLIGAASHCWLIAVHVLHSRQIA
ncbi:MAG: hemolysin III family protein [Halioglobus sp.]|nr:hemolysin III family protein [Halioglobus sp.]